MTTRTYPYLIITKGKHSNSHYLVQNEEERARVGVAIIKDWMSAGYFQKWSVEASLEDFITKKTELPFSEVQALVNNPSLKNIQMKLGTHYETNTPEKLLASLTKEYNSSINHNKYCDYAQQAATNNDGVLAWKLVQHYSGGEYQRVEEERFDNR